MKYVYVILVFLLCGCSRSFRSDSESCKVSVDVDFSVVEECLSLADIVSAKQIIPLSLPKGEVIGRPGSGLYIRQLPVRLRPASAGYLPFYERRYFS